MEGVSTFCKIAGKNFGFELWLRCRPNPTVFSSLKNVETSTSHVSVEGGRKEKFPWFSNTDISPTFHTWRYLALTSSSPMKRGDTLLACKLYYCNTLAGQIAPRCWLQCSWILVSKSFQWRKLKLEWSEGSDWLWLLFRLLTMRKARLAAPQQ